MTIDLKKELRNRGIRPTYQRLRILEVLHRKDTHPTVEEIFKILSPDIPTLVKATIYNAIHAFEQVGLVRTVGIDDNELRYDIVIADHGHFKCKSCTRIFNFEININGIPFNGLQDFEIAEKNVYFIGFCSQCLNRIQKE
jgi:Fe2+ or Zn2+ uptake regulation protein